MCVWVFANQIPFTHQYVITRQLDIMEIPLQPLRAQSVPCLSMFDPQSPVCLTSASIPFRAQTWHALSALARLEEVGFSTVRMHVHEHRHGAPASP